MATLDAEMAQFVKDELGTERLNSHLTSESRAVFAYEARAAIAKGPSQTLHEHVSRTLFGNSKRLDAAVWIATLSDNEAEGFFASQYAEWCRLKGRRWPGDIGGELRRFETLGMVQHVPPAKDAPTAGRIKAYRRLPSPLWDVFIMCDVVIAEAIGERKYYQPSTARTAKMVNELLEIRADLAGDPYPTDVEDPELVELARRRKKVEAAAKARRRPKGPNGELQCTRCKKWKTPDSFSKRPKSSWQYKSWCKECMAVRQRQRYLSVEKEVALNMVGLTFRVSDGDDVVGLSCAGCGQVLEAGDRVHADAKLVHERCMT